MPDTTPKKLDISWKIAIVLGILAFITGFILLILYTTGVIWSGSDNNAVRVKLVPTDESQSRRLARSATTGELFGADIDHESMNIDELQYFIVRVALASGVTFNGTAWSAPTSELVLYERTDVDYSTYTYSNAVTDTTNYVNLMDRSAVAALNIGTTDLASDNNTYEYVIVQWMQPFKIKAAAYNDDGTVHFVTRAGTTNTQKTDTGGGGVYTYYQTTGATTFESTLATDAELMTVVFNSGGTTFKLSKGITIDSSKSYVVYLIYDPYQNLRAGVGDGTATGPGKLAQAVDADYNFWTAGIMDATAIVATPGDAITKKRYRIVLTGNDSNGNPIEYDYLLRVYFLDSAPTTVVAANLAIITKDGDFYAPAGTPSAAPSINGVSFTDGTGWSFLVWNGTAIVDAFETIDSGTCGVRMNAGSPNGDGSQITCAYALIDSESVAL